MDDRDQEIQGRLIADAVSGRMSRRDVLKTAAALGLGASVTSTLVAAATDGVAITRAQEAEVPRERTLICMQGGDNGQNPDFANYNLYVTGSTTGWHSGPLQTMNEPLIMFNVLTGEHENWLAETWEYNADFTEITMTLREGILWSDGTPFTATDVVFTFNLVRDHQNEVINAAEIAFLKEAVEVDPRTIRFVLTAPNPRWWATTLTSNHGVVEQILPKHIWEGQDLLTFSFYDEAQGWPIATGPYKLVSSTSEQKIFDLRQDWWGAQTGFKPLPQVERVIYIPNRDESLTAQMLITNEVDMGKIISVPTLQSVFAQNPNVMTYTGQQPPYGYLDWCPIDLNFNCSAPPWDNTQLRWAINFGLDRAKLVALAESGAGVTARHQFTPYEWFTPYEEALKPLYEKYGLDDAAHLDKVESIMTELGYEKNGDDLWALDGQTLDMRIFVPDYLRAYGPPLTQQLRDAGFNAEFDTSPGLSTQVQTGEQELRFGCKGPSGVKGMDPYFMLSTYTSQYVRPTGEPAPTGWAISRWSNEEYDAIVKQMETMDAEDPQTVELVAQAMDIWFRELPDIFVSQLIIRYPMNSTRWTGWPTQEDPYGFPHSWQQEFMKTIFRLQPAT